MTKLYDIWVTIREFALDTLAGSNLLGALLPPTIVFVMVAMVCYVLWQIPNNHNCVAW